jgi:hypothetical protein
LGAAVNLVVQLYTLYNLNDFRWGKMRKGGTEK